MRRTHLTDDDLWRAIANNTDAMSALIEEQIELDAKWGAPDPATQQKLMLFNVQAINNYDRQYRGFIAEIRRRYPLAVSSRQFVETYVDEDELLRAESGVT